ncbi:MAG: hypothetical protein JEZ01_18030 [Labilibaculum sp.]|nr:hypothetical protein [Labilibaculum sp.]MBI9059668.1 hypothetical protein [Labilibaculum sp.]
MHFKRELIGTLCLFGFRECKKSTNINFLQLNDREYLLLKIFEKAETVDLLHVKYEADDNPCDSEPYWENALKLSFSPGSDNQILKDFIEKHKSR